MNQICAWNKFPVKFLHVAAGTRKLKPPFLTQYIKHLNGKSHLWSLKDRKSATFGRYLCLFTLTNDTFSERGTFESGESQIPNLDRAGGARDEDVVTLQVPVDDGRRSRVQEVKPFQDLSTPALEQL